LGGDTWGPHKSEFHVDLKPLTSTKRKARRPRFERFESVAGHPVEILTFSATASAKASAVKLRRWS